ncbi:hypothetical protein ROZALSC1DRAFT_31062, partial [Rozella allomycis CSF55]
MKTRGVSKRKGKDELSIQSTKKPKSRKLQARLVELETELKAKKEKLEEAKVEELEAKLKALEEENTKLEAQLKAQEDQEGIIVNFHGYKKDSEYLKYLEIGKKLRDEPEFKNVEGLINDINTTDTINDDLAFVVLAAS